MDFRNLLVSQKPTDEWAEITGLPRDFFRLFCPIEFGDGEGLKCAPHFVVSIQASRCHHCEPQEELDDAYLYNSFEVLLTEFASGSERLVNPLDHPYFRQYEWKRHWKHENEYCCGLFVPTADVQQICDDLEELVADLSDHTPFS